MTHVPCKPTGFSILPILLLFSCSPAQTTPNSDGGSLGGNGGGVSSSGGASAGGSASGGSATGGTASGGSASGGTAGTASGGNSGSSTGGDDNSGGAPDTGGAAETSTVSFTASQADFPNPERGFYQYVEIDQNPNLEFVRSGGDTLAFSYLRLDDYRDSAIGEETLSALDQGLANARSAGVKVILRFAYNAGPWPDSEPDASKARILEHIAQLAPHLQAHADVIALVQAGFIGAWGEWHTSTNNLLDNPQDRKDILEALLDALPSSRMTQIRYPAYKPEMYGDALTKAEAYNGSYKARTGHHNDCFLSSSTDVGTYPEGEQEDWKSYLAKDTLYVPMGGETCALHDRSLCPSALAEMERLNFTYLNYDYHTDVIERWQTDGCMPEIRKRLGYRLELQDADLPTAVKPGGHFLLGLRIHNSGFASLFNPRPVQVVLDGAGERQVAEVTGLDARSFAAGETTSLTIRVSIPSSLSEGTYTLALRLPDAAQSLADRPEYCVRFANQDTWRAETGDNALSLVSVDANADGTSDSGIAELLAKLE